MNNIEDKRPEDKQIWSDTKKWFNVSHMETQWGDLTEEQRVAARREFLTPVFGPMVPFGPGMEPFETPEWVLVRGRRFPWNAEQGAYDGLYIEQYLSDGTLTAESYYEITD